MLPNGSERIKNLLGTSKLFPRSSIPNPREKLRQTEVPHPRNNAVAMLKGKAPKIPPNRSSLGDMLKNPKNFMDAFMRDRS
jgi:hypothetical protein